MDEFYCVFTAEVSSLYSRSLTVRNAYYETMWPEKGYFVVDGHLPPDIRRRTSACPDNCPLSTNAPQDIRPLDKTTIKDLSDASVTIPASPAAYPPTGC